VSRRIYSSYNTQTDQNTQWPIIIHYYAAGVSELDPTMFLVLAREPLLPVFPVGVLVLDVLEGAGVDAGHRDEHAVVRVGPGDVYKEVMPQTLQKVCLAVRVPKV
jgi:hypothetical protein